LYIYSENILLGFVTVQLSTLHLLQSPWNSVAVEKHQATVRGFDTTKWFCMAWCT